VSRTFRIAGLILVLGGFVYAGLLYPSLPESVPSHWDASGRVNGTMPKPWGVVTIPLVMAVLWLVFGLLPRISPRGFEMASFARSWGILTVAVLAFLLLIEILTLNAARTAAPLSPRLILGAVGFLFAVIGAVLGKVTRNFFAGIRTPWTLASEEVWNRTHRLAGKLFVAAGLAVAAAALLGLGWWIMIAALALGALVPVIYSYVIYRKLEGFPESRS
jgi:uncharacterized membrane protein